jgi:hypothetical protein
MSVVLLIGPHVLQKIQVRDAPPLMLANLRKADESRDGDHWPSLSALTAAWKPESSLGMAKVVAGGATSQAPTKTSAVSRSALSGHQLATRQQASAPGLQYVFSTAGSSAAAGAAAAGSASGSASGSAAGLASGAAGAAAGSAAVSTA